MDEEGPNPENPGKELVGRILAGRYRILEMLGEGAMGAVYLAEHLHMGRRDAIKVLRPALSKDPEAIARFTRGARNASRVRHPNVCSIYDFGETEDGMAFLAMEYIDGESLQDLLKRKGHLPVPECVYLMHQTADALHAAHEAGIIHRDLKPGNIMLTRGRGGRRVVKVVDFDIAKGSSEGQSSDLTQMGLVIGTPECMSPEQLTADALDGRSDVYSLGMVLFRMLTGVLPFAARTTREVMLQRLTAKPGTLAGAAPDQEFPEGLQAVMDRALARSPEERFPDAEAFAEALEAAAKGRPVKEPDLPLGSSPATQGPSGPTADSPPSAPPFDEALRAGPTAGPPLSPTPEETARTRVQQPPVPDRLAPTPERGESTVRSPAAVHTRRRKGWGVPVALGAVALVLAVVAGVFTLASGDEAAELDLLPARAVLRDGERIQITVAVTGSVDEEARAGGFTWRSANPAVATVDDEGVVTGVGAGTAEIIARIGGLAATAEVTVGGAPEPGTGSDDPPVSGPERPDAGDVTPTLSVARTRVALGSVEGQGRPAPVAVGVDGAGLSGLGVAVAYPAGGASGWLEARLSGTTTPTEVQLRVDPTTVSPGEYEARVDVAGAGGAGASIRVSYTKSAEAQPTRSSAEFALDRVDPTLDRLEDRLLSSPDPAALAALNDTAQALWALGEQVPDPSRGRAAFYAAQAENALGNAEAAFTWAERAVALAPDNDGYRRLLGTLGGGRP